MYCKDKSHSDPSLPVEEFKDTFANLQCVHPSTINELKKSVVTMIVVNNLTNCKKSNPFIIFRIILFVDNIKIFPS